MSSTAIFTFDNLAVTSILLYAALAVITLAARPRSERTTANTASIGLIVAGTFLSYVAASLPLFATGWTLTLIPFLAGWLKPAPKRALATSMVAVVAGAWLAEMGDGTRTIAFGLLMFAALLRKGIFPLHSWIGKSFADGPLLPLGLLLNGHLSMILLLRFVIPRFGDLSAQTLPLVSVLALLTALYAAVLALAESRPRRILAMLSVSQASFLLAGLESRNVEGITGALVHWFVVAAATTGLLCSYRALESRYPGVANLTEHLGLAGSAPRLATFFAICGLALIGLPGTLGFAAEDLLFHGSLESHPLLGLTLPLATALNGITVYRLFSMMFLGRARRLSVPIADALPREGWAMSLVVVFLVVTGIVPGILVTLREPAAEGLAKILGSF